MKDCFSIELDADEQVCAWVLCGGEPVTPGGDPLPTSDPSWRRVNLEGSAKAVFDQLCQYGDGAPARVRYNAKHPEGPRFEQAPDDRQAITFEPAVVAIERGGEPVDVVVRAPGHPDGDLPIDMGGGVVALVAVRDGIGTLRVTSTAAKAFRARRSATQRFDGGPLRVVVAVREL